MWSPRTATKSSPCSPQPEKARVQQQRPNAAKKKKENKKENKWKTWILALFFIMNNNECRVRSTLVSRPLIVRVKSVHKSQGENTPSTSPSIKVMELVHIDIPAGYGLCSRSAPAILVLVLNKCLLISIKWVMLLGLQGQAVLAH